MEARKITITSTRNQNGAKTIMSSAETLGELKADLRAANIDYSDLTFYEGLSRTELIDDNSLLPKDINYKGTVTNNLVFMLTNPNKKIKSGTTARQELFTLIKNNEDLKTFIKVKVGNYTNVSTETLKSLIEEYNESKQPVECQFCDKDTKIDCILNTIEALVQELREVLSSKESKEITSPYSAEDLDEMFDFVNENL